MTTAEHAERIVECDGGRVVPHEELSAVCGTCALLGKHGADGPVLSGVTRTCADRP
ncbi:hypothetical protein [Streptomyces canus]|uniref:hypothetical protein n=1 Tax=Streptomyces canus TaxID=58343 RepID=UPI00131D41D6|nr:hypothetical protein [Streptomyces canus]